MEINIVIVYFFLDSICLFEKNVLKIKPMINNRKKIISQTIDFPINVYNK